MSVLIANLIFYIVLALILLKSKFPGKYIALLPVGAFIISAYCSTKYFNSDLYLALNEAKVPFIPTEAILYIMFGFVIYLTPILFLPYTTEAQVYNEPQRRLKILYYLALFVGVISILPLIENLRRVAIMDFASFAEAYFDNQEDVVDTRSHFSFMGRIFNGILNWLQYLILPLLFYIICFYKEKKWLMILVGCAYINNVIPGLFHGGRLTLFNFLVSVVLNFAIFQRFFTKKQKGVLFILGSVVLFIIIFLLVGMSLARSDDDYSIFYQEVFRYLGEGFVNFGQTAWYTDVYTEGHSVFNGTGQTFMSNISDYFDNRDYEALSNLVGFRMHVYYTVFGDYFIDFGAVGGVILNILLALSFFLLVRNKENLLSSIVFVNIYVTIGINGIFCSSFMNRLEFLLFTLLLMLILRTLEKQELQIQKWYSRD